MKCPDCPARDLAIPCVAETTGHRRYCELVAMGREDYARLVRDLSTGMPPPPPAPPPVPLAAWHDRRDLARACPYRWDDQIDDVCGCHEPRVCLMGRGRENYHLGRLAIVTLNECMACVAAD